MTDRSCSNLLLSIENLHIRLGGYEPVKGTNLNISNGEIIGIIGESGAGKSMLANSILKLLPSTASYSGIISFGGKNLLDLSESEMQKIRGSQIGMIYQDPLSAMNPTMRVGDQIAEMFTWHQKLKKQEAYKNCVELLTNVGIAEPERRFRQYPFEFSGGMRQRALIAMALACKPKLLIADEPTTALDIGIQDEILHLLKTIRTKYNMSILIISHDLHVVGSLCDRIYVMQNGNFVENGTVSKIFKEPAHPYTRSLLNSKWRHRR